MSAPVIRCLNLSKWFGAIRAAGAVDLEVWPGEIVSILGPSGSGKTTLLRLIAGFETPTEGFVHILGSEVSSPKSVVPPEGRNVGMVVQEYALFPHLTVERNIAFGLQKLADEDRSGRIEEVLGLVGMNGLGGRFPHELSGGQQQRVALARTLAPNPVTVLLDEPFSNLDSSMRQRLRIEVERILRSHSTAAIFVTHDREEAFAMADRVGVMMDGELLQIDTPERVYHFPANAAIARLTGTCDFIPGVVRADGRVDTELGVLKYVSPDYSLSAGQHVSVLIHPDDLELIPDRDGNGVVVSREFRGDEVILKVRLDSGGAVRSRRRSFSTLPAGSRVRPSAVKTMPFVAYAVDG